MTSDDLQQLESGAYRTTYSDGIIDLFLGVSLIWIGAIWIWLPDYGGLAGILPAVFVSVMLAARKRIVESRVGYVKWAAPRRRWEHRNLAVLLVAGTALFLIGIAVFVMVDRTSPDAGALDSFMPGLLAWLLALLAVGLGFLMGVWRMFAYAGVLAATGFVTAAAGASPGWPLLAAGIVVTATGSVMLVHFLRRNPVRGNR